MGYFDKVFESVIVERSVAWLKEGRNWVLLLPWTIIVFLGIYFLWPAVLRQKPFTELYESWHALVAVGILCCLGAAIYGVFNRQRPQIRLGTAPLLVFGVLLLGLGALQKPAPLPDDKIVVAVARFIPVSDAAKEDAQNIRFWLVDRLDEKEKEGQPIKVLRWDSIEITGSTDDEMRSSAAGISRGRAHIVVWGEVQRELAIPYVRPRICITTQPQTVQLEANCGRRYPPSFEPDVVKFRRRVADDMADLPLILHGMALLKLKRWDEAQQKFRYVASDEGRLHEGLSFYEKAGRSRDPAPLLEAAVEVYQKSVPTGGWHSDAEMSPTRLSILGNMANALQALGSVSEGGHSAACFSRAVEHYKTLLNSNPSIRRPQDWAVTQNNLGIALRELSTRREGENRNRLLEEAAEAYRSALTVYTEKAFPQMWVITQNNLGNALGDLGFDHEGEDGHRLLEEAIKAYRAALRVCTEKEQPQVWGTTHHNLGATLSDLGLRRSGEAGNSLLEEAVLAYRAALRVRMEREVPQQWAGTQNNLGNALASLGIRRGGEEGTKLLDEAVACFDRALSIYDSKHFPRHSACVRADRETALKAREDLLGPKE